MDVTDLERLPEAQRGVRARCYHPSGMFVPFPAEALTASLSQRFEQMVQNDPNRIAVRTRSQTYTYSELDVLADRIAKTILVQSTARHEPVSLLFRHGASVIGAMIGALKAGRPYVALDTSYPVSRLAHLLTDSTSRLILTDHEHLEQARGLAGSTAAVLDIESLEETPDIPSTPAGPLDAALLVYTSGSTGQPKGVVQSHRNVLYDVMHYANSGHFCADDRFLLVSSTSFADSLRTIYGALLNGAGLYPYDIRGEGLDPLADWITSNALTIYRSVPTVFRQFAGTLTGSHDFRSVRLLYLAGEPVKRADVDLYKRHFPPECILVDRLGTTEALTYRHNFIDHDAEITSNLVPVGYSFGDKEVLLLDEQGNAVPTGTEGEIVVRSRYLSEGYWRRPDLTRAAFDVDSVDPEVRTYHTGDLGRFQADGALECLGRKDQQVKIRGHRIEAAEVEAAMLAVGGIREAVVTAEHRASEDRLIAYYVPDTGAALDAAHCDRRWPRGCRTTWSRQSSYRWTRCR